jgi:uncharacterized protein (DUF697 family)
MVRSDGGRSVYAEKGPVMAQSASGSASSQDEQVAEVTVTNAETPEVTPAAREEMASKLVERFALWSGGAGLIPIPVVDALAVGGLQLQLLRRLSQIYDVPFGENRGKALIASIAGAMIPATSGIGAASLLKSIPILGTLAAVFVMPTLSAGATYALGKAFIQHFKSGGTLLDFNPPDYREFIKAQKEMWDSRSRPKVSPPAATSAESSSTTGAAATNP